MVYIGHIQSSPLFDAPVVDALTYVEDAHYLSQQSWSGKPQPYWQPPLYPYLLATIFSFAGSDLYLPRLLQAFLGAASCVLTFLIGCRLFPFSVALAAGLFAALYGPLIYFDGELLPTTLAVFLDLSLLFFLLSASLSRRLTWLLAGLLLGLSALAVANTLLLVPVLLLWHWRTGASSRHHRVQQGLFLLVGCALVIAPVTIRNYLVGDDLVLISHNAGINFYIGNNADYETTFHIRPGADWAYLVEMPKREAGLEKPSEKSRYFFARSWDYIAARPLDYLALLGHKLYLFWRGDELLRNLDPYFARHDSALLAALLWKYGLAFPFGLVSPLALLGLVVLGRRSEGRSPAGRLFLLFFLTYMVSVVLFFVTARYRLPTAPLLLLLAGYGVYALVTSTQRKKWLVAFPVLLLLSNAGIGTMDMEGNALQHYWLGYVYEQKGMPANAVREYRTALRRQPDFQDALLNLAALHGEQQQYGRAIDLYRRFLEFYPEEARVHFLLGNASLQAGRHLDAIDAFEKIAVLRPRWAAIHGRLGYTYLMADQPERAAAAYRRTLELNPDSTLVRYQLARLYTAENRLDLAVDQYRRLLAQYPEQAEYHTRLADALIKQEESGRETVYLEQTPRARDAEEHLMLAIALRPDDRHPYWSLGMLLARQQRYPEAIPLFEKLLKVAPQDYQAHLFLGHLYKRTSRSAKAAQHFDSYTRDNLGQHLQKKAMQDMEKQLEALFNRNN